MIPVRANNQGLSEISKVGMAACACRKAWRGQENKLVKTPMKKLVYLALLAAFGFVVGCEKKAETPAAAPAAAATNAVTK